METRSSRLFLMSVCLHRGESIAPYRPATERRLFSWPLCDVYERVSTFQFCIIVRVALCLGRRFESLCARSRNSVRSHFLLCYFLRRKAKSHGDAENRTVKDRHRFAAYLLVLRKSRVLKSLGKGTLRSVYVRNAREQGKQRAAWVYLKA